MNNPKLLPCPFCGGEAEVATGTDRCGYWWVKAYCRLCRAGIAESYNPKREWVTVDDGVREVVAAWNRRADTVAKLAEPYNFSLLCDWYIHSVTGKPVWTEAHIKELLHDFYLIPKGDLP